MRWLSVACDMKIPSKTAVKTKYRPKKLGDDIECRRLLALQTALQHLIMHGETLDWRRSVERKCRAIPHHHIFDSMSYVEMKEKVHILIESQSREGEATRIPK